MNSRIKELALSIPRIADMYNVDPVHRAAVEEFAELIIKECAGITLDYKNDNHYTGWCDHAEEILKRFKIK